MNELKIFENQKFGQVRTIEKDGKILFAGSDVARALGYAIPSKAVNTHCKGVSKMEAPTNGGVQEMLFICEGDVYRLAAKSELPGAEEFESWIFDEVLPSVRKHGAYMTPETVERAIQDPDFVIGLLTNIKAMQEKVEMDKPKVIFADAVSASSSTILVGELAKFLRQNGIDIGQNRLFERLRNEGYLSKRKGDDWNMPTQRSMDMGLFEIKKSVHVDGNGCNVTKRTPKVTGKGQQYFINKFLGGEAV